MSLIKSYQQQLLDQAQYAYRHTPISAATQQAYWAVPRHLFVQRYREWGVRKWHEIRPENLKEHLATLYQDRPLILFGDDDDCIPSTISVPSFVLRMLDMLQLRPGQSVFELGAGSGWNAALMGQLVGPTGHVSSVEIIPEIAQAAASTIASLNQNNVSIIPGDGGEGYAPRAPYDRAIFTAGSYDLPRHFYDQIREDGLLLIVIKSEGGGDNLFLLRKKPDCFESLDAMTCSFVQLTGKYQLDLEPTQLEALPEWAELQHCEVFRMPFWWGGKGKEDFQWRTSGIRFFLSVSEPIFRTYKIEVGDNHSREEHYFGLWDQANHSLVLAKDDLLIAYGNTVAKEVLLQKTREWLDLGMPSAASFKLCVYPSGVPLTAHAGQWLVKRCESQFLWCLEN